MKARAKLCLLALAALGATAAMVVVLLRMRATATPRVPTVTSNRATASHDNDSRDGDNRDEEADIHLTVSRHLARGHDDSYLRSLRATTKRGSFLGLKKLQAVGRMITRNGSHCSGAFLRNASSLFFLTAARCLDDQASSSNARVELVTPHGAMNWMHSRVFHMNRKVGVLLLALEAGDASINAFERLQLRPDEVEEDTTVAVPHYTKLGGKRIAIAHKISGDGLNQKIYGRSPLTPSSVVTYVVPAMDEAAAGAPMISTMDSTIVAVHICAGQSTAGTVSVTVSSASIANDLRTHGRLLHGFTV